MDGAGSDIRGLDDTTRGRAAPTQPTGVRRSPGAGAALAVVDAETLSMDAVNRFFNRSFEPQGNSLVGDIVDENGPLAGRESARGKRKPGGLAMQFNDVSRSLLFAPNDAPDELPQEPTELDRLLLQQAFRERRSFTA
ncbi:MAG: hypothetical protein JWM30_3864 [Burkholderia sp.]|nr:hypothetical protein [Burkholderia sp.]